MTLNPRCDKVETAKGVAITVTGVAQVKVIKEHDLLKTACEQFLGKGVHEIEGILLQTLEGHLRAILGTLTVEEIYKGTLNNILLIICSFHRETQSSRSRLILLLCIDTRTAV